MMLLTKKDKDRLPKLYAQDGKGKQAIAYVKFFSIQGDWTFFATEFDPDNTQDFFGLTIENGESHLGYHNLSEMAKVKSRFGIPAIERDRSFRPKTLEECETEFKRHQGN